MAWAGQILKYEDFDWDAASQIGMGALAKVYRVKYLKDGKDYAIKVVSKLVLVHENKVDAAMNEKTLMQSLYTEREICQLMGTLQTEEDLFFVMEYFPKGNLEMLSIRKSLSRRVVAEITSQIVKGLEKIHAKGYVHRDIKPENICIRDDGSVAIIDFDTCTKCTDMPVPNTIVTKSIHELSPEENARKYSVSEIQSIRRKTQQFAGTAQYISPEMLDSCTWSYSSDIWALGCVVYQISTGVAAFSGPGQFDVFRKIVKGTIDFSLVTDPVVNSFCQNVMVLNPVDRLGVVGSKPGEAGYLSGIKEHELFNDIDWERNDHSHVLAEEPEEDKIYIEKMVGSTPSDPFDEWIAKKTTPAPPPTTSNPPPAPEDASITERAACVEEDLNVIDDVGTASFKPFLFPSRES